MEETMTRAECEDKIKDLFNQIVDVYKEYNPNGQYLSVSLTDGCCFLNNACYGKGENYDQGADYDIPVNTHWEH
jgi:hypothetical protein